MHISQVTDGGRWKWIDGLIEQTQFSLGFIAPRSQKWSFHARQSRQFYSGLCSEHLLWSWIFGNE